MKYRGSGKIKRDHSIIKGLDDILKKIEPWEEVQSIIPGRINKAKQGGKIQLRINYETNTGLKCIAAGYGSVQEVFFVAKNPAIFLEKLVSSKILG